MRTLIALAFVAAFGVTAAHANDGAQVAAKEPAAAMTSDAVTKAQARDIARTWMKENNYRQGRVGDIQRKDGTFIVELKTVEGIRFATLKINATTGEISG